MNPEDCEACWRWNDEDAPCHHQKPRKPHLMKTARLPKPWFVSHRHYRGSTVRSFYTFDEAAAYARTWTPFGVTA